MIPKIMYAACLQVKILKIQWPFLTAQPARKVMPDSWELVNFPIAHVNSVLNLLTDDWVFLREFKLQGRVVKSLVKITHA